jgi:hypothetical protein
VSAKEVAVRTSLTVAALAGVAAGVQAQQQITPGSVAYTLEYERVSATGTVLGGGALQPGEWVSLRLRFQYAPQYGTPVTWAPSILQGSSGSGTMEGFWSGNLDITVSGGGPGTWSGVSSGSLPVRRQLVSPFNGSNPPGSGIPTQGGTVLSDLLPGQFTGNINSVNSSNNFAVWRGAWRPASYSEGMLTFALRQGSLGLPTYLAARDSNPAFELPVAGTVPATYGGVVVPMVPSPSSLVVIGGAGWIDLRRTRRGCASPGERP